MLEEKSLKDYLYTVMAKEQVIWTPCIYLLIHFQSNPCDPWENKYKQVKQKFTSEKIARYGAQVLDVSISWISFCYADTFSCRF